MQPKDRYKVIFSVRRALNLRYLQLMICQRLCARALAQMEVCGGVSTGPTKGGGWRVRFVNIVHRTVPRVRGASNSIWNTFICSPEQRTVIGKCQRIGNKSVGALRTRATVPPEKTCTISPPVASYPGPTAEHNPKLLAPHADP